MPGAGAPVTRLRDFARPDGRGGAGVRGRAEFEVLTPRRHRARAAEVTAGQRPQSQDRGGRLAAGARAVRFDGPYGEISLR